MFNPASSQHRTLKAQQSMAKQKNVQTQNAEVKARIKECALNFRKNRNMPQALLDCFEALNIDLKLDILTAQDRMPFGGPTQAYRGVWLTTLFQFFEYEIYLDLNDNFVTEIEIWTDITDQVNTSERNRGTGKSSGWLAIEVMKELNA